MNKQLKGIAIIGMAGKFPGARNIAQFWQNLCNGVESISSFSDEELLASGIDPAFLQDPNYVKAGFVLEDVEMFDASFFGYSPGEAEILDPQQRVFLECAWVALEDAGYAPKSPHNLTGVYAGGNLSTYLLNNLALHPELLKSHNLPIALGNDKDSIATRVSYKLNLKGPSVSVGTACSTSLVAVHLACRGLLSYQCDMALAGGIAIQVPQVEGYFYQADGMTSPDGRTRAFDAEAKGVFFGRGVGIVVLKRLEEAVADGDYIYGVIKGSAINNDGAVKVSYTAPSVAGQAEVIAEAQAIAGFDPETITYIEAHGTGTVLGDPIEIQALEKVFRAKTNRKGYCAIGSVKTNVSHLSTAAGVTSLIKTALALKHQQLPASLNFSEPNPEIDFANSPFYVNTQLSNWQTNGKPRRAGVSSFGLGGTNAHVVLEESLTITPAGPSRPWQLLLLSAKTATALEAVTTQLTHHLQQHPEIGLADVAFTLQVGRWPFEHRRMVVCQGSDDMVQALKNLDPKRVLTRISEEGRRSVIFMFSGQGSQYLQMGRDLYEHELVFRKHVDRCCELLQSHLKLDLRQVLYADPSTEEVAAQLQQTAIAQPALFVIEYSLAQLWQEWGVHPEAMIGHSIGEYVAATMAGVFSLEDALAVVATRGKLMQQLPPGYMLAISLPEQQVQSWLEQSSQQNSACQIAVVNSPSACVVSGSQKAVASLQNQLSAQGIACRRLHTSHAFHSEMMEPILEPFEQALKTIKLNPPRIRFISNVTGDWITAEQATSPSYWGQHLRQAVRFSAGVSKLLEQFEGVFLEVGPGRTLSTLTTQHLPPQAKQQVLSSLHHAKEAESDVRFLLQTLGRLWLAGVNIDWSGFYAHEQRHRLPLPTYPFERQRYWIEPPKPGANNGSTPLSLGKKPNLADWFYLPFWKPSVPPARPKSAELTSQESCTLVFMDECGLGSHLVKGLETVYKEVITVKVGSEFTQLSEGRYTLNPGHRDDYDALLKAIAAQQKVPERIVHLWNVTPVSETESGLPEVEKAQERGFYSLLFLAQAIGKQNLSEELQLTVISNNLQSVTGEEQLSPEKATLLGPVKVISQEYPNISCCSIDVVLPTAGGWQQEKLTDQLLTELRLPISERVIAYRGHNRWLQTFEPVRLEESIETPRLRKTGVYLITGGLGGIGLVLAKHLAEAVQAKLVLTGRSAFPAREEWSSWLETHEETDSTSRKIRQVQELEALGAEVLVISADVADLSQMREAITQAQQQFGQLHGVIHAAGVPSGGVIQRKTLEDVQKILAPKVNGTLVLERLLRNVDLDFWILCSSVSSLLGGFGQIDYCGANAFLDAFAYYQTVKNGRFVNSINWGAWQEVGMAVTTAIAQQLQELRAENVQQGIAPNEGTDALRRILGATIPQVIVSPSDFNYLLKQSRSYDKESFLEALETINQSRSKHPRPELGNDYVVPRNEIEQKLAEIWQQILGVERIGIYDNFFELGGDSLLGTQVISKLDIVFNSKLSIAKLYECPNISSMAGFLISEDPEVDVFEERLARGKRRRQMKIQRKTSR